jgi:hypothetical protein
MVTSIGDPFFGASAPVEGAVHSIKSSQAMLSHSNNFPKIPRHIMLNFVP